MVSYINRYFIVIYIYIYIYKIEKLKKGALYSYDRTEITIKVTCYCQSSYEGLRQPF